ncbi:hypothetical protein EBB07_34505 [Paenibacillaceae bacterium]|nr:hypothetical protein EBB07_34505 [Paenibacillaceae bacterium]
MANRQVEQTEQAEQIEQAAQTEQTTYIERSEQMEQTEQTEQTTYIEWSVQLEQTSYIELQTDKAMYKPGEEVRISVQIHPRPARRWSYSWVVMDLEEAVLNGSGELLPDGEADQQHVIKLGPLGGSGAYGFFLTAGGEQGASLQGEIAFDVAAHWREAPRYGFLTDFAPGDADDSDITFMKRHHINVVQFYDWMYRHDQLVPEAEDEFIEPLGRQISLQVVRRKIAGLRQAGMESAAYAAVYASLADYAAAHPEQLLYNNGGQPYKLGDYYYIMDISPDSAWTAHIIAEFGKVMAFGFDALHLDQYGFPKKAVRKGGRGDEVVHLKDVYPSFINQTRDALPEAGLIFNNVSAYPIHTTAGADQDAMYIEVWDPVASLADIKHNIDRARELSGKQVILAAYLPCFQNESGTPLREAEYGATVAMAAIFASGGYHLLLGEHGSVLADSYYPNYGATSAEFQQTLTRYYDFIVMYRNLLFDLKLEDISMTFAGGINTEVVFASEGVAFAPDLTPDSVWNIVKEKPGYTVIHLINLCGLDNVTWHAGKQQPPKPVEQIVIKVEMLENVEGVYWATPDGGSMKAQPLSYDWELKDEHQGYYLTFTLPRLAYWSMVYVKTGAGSAAVNAAGV